MNGRHDDGFDARGGRHVDEPRDPADARLEQELRRLFEDRDPGAAPRTLRERVDHIPEVAAATGARRDLRAGARTTFTAIAGLAAALLVLAILLPVFSGAPSGPAASAAASGIPDPVGTFPPGAPRDYGDTRAYWSSDVIETIDPALAAPVLATLAAVLLLLAAATRSLRLHLATPGSEERDGPSPLDRLTPRRQVVGWALAAGTVVLVGFTGQPLAGGVHAYGGLAVLQVIDGNQETVAPHPGQVTMLEVSITNRGLLPLVVEGTAWWPSETMPDGRSRVPIQPERFVTMRTDPATGLALPEPGPVFLWPGQQTYARMLLRHLPCSLWDVPSAPTSTPWPTYNPSSTTPIPDGTVTSGVTTLPVRLSIMGIERVVEMSSGFAFGQVLPSTCPPTEPMPAVDVSRVPADLAMTASWTGILTPGNLADGGPDLVGWAAVLVPLLLMALGIALLRGRRARVIVGVIVVSTVAGMGVSRFGYLPAPLSTTDVDLLGQAEVAHVSGDPRTFNPGSGGTLTFPVKLHNGDLLPITLVGSMQRPGQLRVTALGQPWGTPSANPADTATLGWTHEIAGGADFQLLVQATAGSCVVANDAPHDAWVQLASIGIFYERLGVRHDDQVPLATPIRVPADRACLDAHGAEYRGPGETWIASP